MAGGAAKINWDFPGVSYGPDPLQKFDMACGKKGSVHAVVYIHGGAFFTGSRAQYPSFMADFVESSLVAAIDYRVISPDNDMCMADILSDINTALSALLNLSRKNGIEIRDFVLIGHSAGGHLGLMYGYGCPQKSPVIKIAACMSMAGPADFSDDLGWSEMTMWGQTPEDRLAFYSWMGSRLAGAGVLLSQTNWTAQKNYPEIKKLIDAISPLALVSDAPGIPPTLQVHGRDDNQVPYSNAVRLKKALDCASVPNKLITPGGDGSGHMLGGKVERDTEPVSYADQAWVNEAKEWLEPFLRGIL
ncbi:MAG: alpha/beta hydrolase [Treponema sp.]|nr:alpha/beta hydrolase [Treponema sp.]